VSRGLSLRGYCPMGAAAVRVEVMRTFVVPGSRRGPRRPWLRLGQPRRWRRYEVHRTS